MTVSEFMQELNDEDVRLIPRAVYPTVQESLVALQVQIECERERLRQAEAQRRVQRICNVFHVDLRNGGRLS